MIVEGKRGVWGSAAVRGWGWSGLEPQRQQRAGKSAATPRRLQAWRKEGGIEPRCG